MKSRFVSMASHEFRTPLTTMMSSLSLTSKYGEQNDLSNQEKHIQKIKNSIHNMTDILNDFLSVSKLEEGKIVNMPLELNLKTLITEIVGEIEALTTKDHLLKYTHQGTETVELDPKLLQGVLFNLLSNAIKFSPEGGAVDLVSQVNEDEIRISVKDSGIGISKEDQEHLFERFFRGQNATHIQGTGLGLNIIASYLKLMNGTIRIDSEENKGTLITLIFKR
jgi:signal transduction histidine kinase